MATRTYSCNGLIRNYFHEKLDEKKLKIVETKIFRLAWLPVLVLKTANQAQ